MNRVAHIIHLDYARRQQLTGKGIGIAIFDTGECVILLLIYYGFGSIPRSLLRGIDLQFLSERKMEEIGHAVRAYCRHAA